MGSILIASSFWDFPTGMRHVTPCLPFTSIVQSPQKPTPQLPRKASVPSCSSRTLTSASKTLVSGSTSTW